MDPETDRQEREDSIIRQLSSLDVKIKQLKKVQLDQLNRDVEFLRKVHELEVTVQQRYADINDKRRQIVDGTGPVTEEETATLLRDLYMQLELLNNVVVQLENDGDATTTAATSNNMPPAASGAERGRLGTTTPRGISLVPGPPLADPPASALRCRYCGKTLATMSSFNKHVRTQHEQPPSLEICTICSATFADKKQLRDHVKLVHPVVNRCRYCGYVYAYSGNLARHEASCRMRNLELTNKRS